MLDRVFLKSYFNGLETPTLQELLDKRSELHGALAVFREPEARRDARFLLKHLNREILARTLFWPDQD